MRLLKVGTDSCFHCASVCKRLRANSSCWAHRGTLSCSGLMEVSSCSAVLAACIDCAIVIVYSEKVANMEIAVLSVHALKYVAKHWLQSL